MRFRPPTSAVKALLGSCAAALGVSACFALGEGVLPNLHDDETDAGQGPLTFLDAAPPTPAEDASLPDAPPHSVRSVDPSHGPFTGGQRAIVRGTGFSSSVRIWFGVVEVPSADVVAVDPGRVQVTVPAGSAGTVDVSAQNGEDASTRVTAPSAYVYDRFTVAPSSGPVSGGTIITLRGDGTGWGPATEVLVDGLPCAIVARRSPEGAPQEIDCRTPPGTPGAKRVSVVSGDTKDDVLDAFTYGDSENGFRGGLSGEPLAGTLHVVALNAYTGRGLSAATVVLGSSVDAASVKTADENGVVVVNDPALTTKQTVTVAAKCFMPVTFVDVPVKALNVYLDPILSPACADNGSFMGVGTGGGSTRSGSKVSGELVWPGGIEFRRATWDVPEIPEVPNVPDAGGPRQVAYVFELGRDVTQQFRLPAADEAITPDSDGRIGYSFSKSAGVGSLTLYALAGIEDRTLEPPLFTAYTLGILGGVGATPGGSTDDVFLQMNIPLDHAITLAVTGPQPTARGPDRVESSVGVRLGNLGYVILPVGTQGALLPTAAPMSFVGLPPLVGGLMGAEYVTTGTAFTGESHSPPRSVLGRFATTTSGTMRLDGFVEVPELDVPPSGSSWNGQDLVVSAAPGGPEIDLTLFDVQSGGGLSTWRVIAPRGVDAVRLPDLSLLGSLGLIDGPMSITVTRARIEGFDYGKLRYADLAARGWDSHATDVFQTHR